MAPSLCWDLKLSNERSFVKVRQEITKPGLKVWKKALSPCGRSQLQFVCSDGAFVVVFCLGKPPRLVRNENSCSPWGFSAPSSEDLAWISNQVDPTRFFMFFHADHTCS